MRGQCLLFRAGVLMLCSVLAVLMPAAPAAAGAGYFASGTPARVVGRNPYALANTRTVRGSVFVHSEDAQAVPGEGRGMRVDAEFADGTTRYRVTGGGLAVRWFTVDRGAIPRVGPRLIAWGWVQVSRNGTVIAQRTPATVTVVTDPPITGIGLEIATAQRDLRGIADGYLHVLWSDPIPLTVAAGAARPPVINGY